MTDNVNSSHLDIRYNNRMLKKLSELKLGDKAVVQSLDIKAAASRQKLFAFGLIPGAVVEVLRIAPLGDPMQINLNGDLLLSIRKLEGQYVSVKVS